MPPLDNQKMNVLFHLDDILIALTERAAGLA